MQRSIILAGWTIPRSLESIDSYIASEVHTVRKLQSRASNSDETDLCQQVMVYGMWHKEEMTWSEALFCASLPVSSQIRDLRPVVFALNKQKTIAMRVSVCVEMFPDYALPYLDCM